MLIIPVLDIKGGLVVRASMGLRHAYRPIETPLSPTSQIDDVAEGLRSIYPFPVFYIADLNAIENNAESSRWSCMLPVLDPPPCIWLDAGFYSLDDIRKALDMDHVFPVLGSETQHDSTLLGLVRAEPRLILSLDFRGDDFLGPPDILANSDLWPSRVIVMTLAKVGSGSGPDFDRLKSIRSRAGNREVIAAGGIRSADDLEDLERLGIAAALVATSLHNGALTREAVSALMNDVPPRN
ncbi:MAG: HisA/HisF-related TIM barrel protein [Phyllobacterium sp.]